MSKISLGGDDRFTCLWRIYAPPAHEPYMQSLSRSGLLEPRIETTFQDRLNNLPGGFFDSLNVRITREQPRPRTYE